MSSQPFRNKSLKEAAKRGATKPPSPSLSLQNQPKSAGKPPKLGKPLVIGTEPVKALCGHIVEFELFEAKKDKFREQRRKKAQERLCPTCRVQKHAEKVAADQKAAQERKKNKPKRFIKLERLPHGSKFSDVIYDAKKTMWSGELSIPNLTGPAGLPLIFCAEEPAVFKLLSKLDKMYRDWLWEQENGKSQPDNKDVEKS